MTAPTTAPYLEEPRLEVAADADHERVTRILEAHYAGYAGPLDRAREPRVFPTLDSQGQAVTYLVATLGGEDVGTAGVTPKGDLTEWGVLAGPGAGAVAVALLDAAEAWARKQGASELNILVAGNDTASLAALRQRGFRELVAPVTVMRVTHFPRFLTEILGARRDALGGFPRTSVHVHLEPGLYPQLHDEDLMLDLGGGEFRVERGAGPADLTIATTATHFAEFLLGALPPGRFALRRARIRPLHRWGRGLQVAKLLAPRLPWYSPLGERR